MDKDDATHFNDALRAGNHILDFVENLEFETFDNNELCCSAVERKFEIIGEALRRVRDSNSNLLEENWTEARQAIAFRNRLAHGYDKIDNGIMWGIIKGPLPILLSTISKHLSDFDKENKPNSPS